MITDRAVKKLLEACVEIVAHDKATWQEAKDDLLDRIIGSDDEGAFSEVLSWFGGDW